MFKEQLKNQMVEFFYVGFCFCVNDNKGVDLKCPQMMKCILCYNCLILVCNSRTQVNKGLILYNTTNGITTLKKHVNVDHSIIAKKF